MGILVSDDILLSADPLAEHTPIATAYTAEGERIVSWINSDNQLVTQRFDAQDVPVGDEIVLATHATWETTSLRSLSPTSDGGWIQTFTKTQKVDGVKVDYLHVVQYGADGNLLLDHVEKNDKNQIVEVLGDDGLIIFSSEYVLHDQYQVTATIFDSQGHQIAQKDIGLADAASFTVNTSYGNGNWSADFMGKDGTHRAVLFDGLGNALISVEAEITASVRFENGGYVIERTVYDNDVAEVQRTYSHYDADGTLISEVVPPVYDYGAYYGYGGETKLSNGNQVALWTSAERDKPGQLHLRVLDSQGNMIVADTDVGETDIYGPSSVLELSNGGWVVFWYGHMQAFNADGTKTGPAVEAFPQNGGIPRGIKATVDGGWTVTYQSDGSLDLPSGIYYRTFYVNDVNNAPHALYSAATVYEDRILHFGSRSFNSYDYDGDKVPKIEIETLPLIGQLRLNGQDVHAGDVITASDFGKLTWTPPTDLSGEDVASFQFKAIDKFGTISTKPATFHINLSEVNDRPSGADHTITMLEDETRILTKDDFAFSDPDGNELYGVFLKYLSGDIDLYVDNVKTHKQFSRLDQKTFLTYLIAGKNEYGDHFATLSTKVTDNGGEGPRGHDTEATFHTLTINVLPVNDAPNGTNVVFFGNPHERMDFIDQYFKIRDVENDNLKSIIIDTLPEFGTLWLGNERVKAGTEIDIDDTGRLSFDPGSNIRGKASAMMQFSVRDDGGTANGGLDIDTTANIVKFNIVTDTHVVHGTRRNDHLEGVAGHDFIYGGAGDDTIFGGAASDRLYGGSGSDVFVLKNGNGDDTIKDFDAEQDRIDLRGSSIHNLASLKNHAFQMTDDLAAIGTEYKVHGYERSDLLKLEGVHLDDLTADNFIF